MREYEKMISESLYKAFDNELTSLHNKCSDFLDELNSTKFNDFEKRYCLIKQQFKYVGKNVVINKPFYCDYGVNITIGDNFYANFDCVMLDVAPISIGNNVFFAPHVSIYTATHPIDKDIRAEGLEYGLPVIIGNDCWLGGNVVVNPGVTIGDGTVIGSGSVVTKDIPSGVVAVGNPCKVIRKISDDDKEYWNKKKREYEVK